MTLLHMHSLRRKKKTYKTKYPFLLPLLIKEKTQNIELSLCWVCPHILLQKNTKNYDAIVNPMHPKFQRFVSHTYASHLSALVKHWLKLVVYLQVALFKAISPAQKTRQFSLSKCYIKTPHHCLSLSPTFAPSPPPPPKKLVPIFGTFIVSK